jgi:CRP-like cAMP-binding protein
MKAASSPSQDAFQFLKSQPLFKGLSDHAVAQLARASHWKRVRKGTPIFFQGDAAEAAYLVCSGWITILLTSADGRELVINEMRAGDCFGELALLTGQPRSTGAVARLESLLLVLPRSAFLAIVDSEPRLARRLLDTTAQRLSISSERESALAFLDAQARLARVLIHLDHLASEKGYVTVSQEELAQRTGQTRQTVAKALGKWRRSGWLVTGRGRIMLINHAALEKLEQKLEN